MEGLRFDGFADASREQDKALFVTFYVQTRPNKEKSAAEGRHVVDEIERVIIETPGDKTTIKHRDVTDDVKERFLERYNAWKNKQTATGTANGTPLKDWPLLGRARVEELEASKVFTVDQLAALSDEQLKAIGHDGLSLRKQAQAYLQAAREASIVTRLTAEAEKRDAENAELRDLVANLSARLDDMQNNEKPRARRAASGE